MIRFTLLALLMVANVKASSKRHVIYWNAHMSPELLSDSDYVLHVKIGQFMDILCPQTSLMGITNGPQAPAVFDLYNVTQTDYDQCSGGGRRNFIFACDRPERENKLTIKFQLISPSPLGFKFQYCQDYYFVAVPRKRTTEGCNDKVSTRLRISVACKHPQRPPRPRPTTTTTSTARTTTLSTTEALDLDEDIVIPKVVKPGTTEKTPQEENSFDVEPNLQSQTSDEDGPGGSALKRQLNLSLFLTASILTVMWSCVAFT